VSGALLLTGATGFVGMELLLRYLERTERRVFVLVRGRDEGAARKRLRSILSEAGGYGDHADRLVVVNGSLTEDGLGLAPGQLERLAEDVTDIVHSAASVSFSLPLPESRAVNVEGTRRMLELAALCQARGGLRSFAHVSTAYVAGTHRGRFAERDLDVGQGFRNAYERSKFEAELLVRERADRLPVQVFRPSIVVGDRSTGWTRSFNVLYWPLRAFAHGAYRALPARRDTPVDVVSVDYVADAIVALAGRPDGAGRTYHLTAGPDATTVGELVALAARYFGRPAPLLVSPAAYRRILHPLLVGATRGAHRRALVRSEAYFPYFAMDVRFDDASTRERREHAGLRVTPLERYFHRLVDFAVEVDWGRRPGGRAPAVAA